MRKLRENVCIFFTLAVLMTSAGVPFQSDWTLISAKNNIKLWTKDRPNSRIKQFKVHTTSDKDIRLALVLLKDVVNMHKWYDKVESVTLLKKINDNEAIYLLEYDLPFPFDNRVSTIKGRLSFDTQIRKIKVSTTYFPYDIPDHKKHLPLVTDINSQWEISTTSDGQIDINHSGYMDPGGNIPDWIINQSVTSGPVKTINAFIQALDQ